MAENTNNLPDLNENKSGPTETQTSTGDSGKPIGWGGGEVNSKEMVIGFGVVVIAAIIFFFVKNYVSKMLVASFKKSPRSADMAGWSLFCLLLLATITAVLGILSSASLFSLPYLIPIILAMIVSLIMLIIALNSKR